MMLVGQKSDSLVILNKPIRQIVGMHNQLIRTGTLKTPCPQPVRTLERFH